MSLTLYDLSHSPYCIPVRRVLEALGVSYETVEVPNWDRRLVIDVTEGAYYQVPVLVHEGRVIYEVGADTNDVPHYIDETFAAGRLFPASLAGLQELVVSYMDNELENATFRCADAHYVDSIPDLVARTMVLRHKERRFGKGCVEQWKRELPELRSQVAGHLARFDAMLRLRPFVLTEDHPVYADFLLYGILGNYTYQGWNPLPAGMSALAAWQERLRDYRF